MPTPISSPTAEPLLEALAARIAGRDLHPDATAPNRFEPAQVLLRLADALAPLLPGRNHRGRLGQARMLYCFMAHATQTAAQLAAAAGIGRVAGSHAHNGLLRAGLLRGARQGPGNVYRLSRWGEDWLLALGRAEVPPARPA